MASDSSSGFRRGISHFFTATKNTTKVEGQKNNMDLGQLQAQEREVCVTILFSFSCICRLSWACILRETSTKATCNANISLTIFPHCLILLTVLPLDSSALRCRRLSLGSFVNSPSLFSRTSLPSSNSGFAGDLELKPFVWVSRQNRQRNRLPSAHTHIVSHLINRDRHWHATSKGIESNDRLSFIWKSDLTDKWSAIWMHHMDTD